MFFNQPSFFTVEFFKVEKLENVGNTSRIGAQQTIEDSRILISMVIQDIKQFHFNG